MLKRIAEILLRSKIERENKARKKKYIPWDKAQKLALIISSDQIKNKSSIDRYIEGTKKYVEVFVIETESKAPSYADWNCMIKKDKSFLKLPTRGVLDAHKGKQFDVLINVCSESNLFATSLSSTLQASLKCGRNDRFGVSDLIIKREDNFDLIKFLDDLTGYLKVIKD